MSTFRVELTAIKEILPHNNADRLEIVKVYDWTVVTQKGKYAVGDLVLYIPVDSVLPIDLEQQLFPPDSKIKLLKSRIRSIRIRGVVSQGMVVDPVELKKLEPAHFKDGTDVAEVLGITKYEPPDDSLPAIMQVKKAPKKKDNPNFNKYTDIENFKWYDRVFQDGEQVYLSEKLHGTSSRFGWVKVEANTWWLKVKKFLGLLPEWEFCWGSRKVQIQRKLIYQGYYDVDIYTKVVRDLDLKNRIPKGMCVYGEIVGYAGDGLIQKGYAYGCRKGEYKFFVYDIQVDGVWLDYPAFNRKVKELGLTPVPWLYTGPYSREVLETYRSGDSTVGNQKVREGLIIKPIVETSCCFGRKVLKVISDEYYLNVDNTDNH